MKLYSSVMVCLRCGKKIVVYSVLVKFIAIEMQVIFHAGDIGVVDILLVEVFDDCNASSAQRILGEW